MSEVIEILESEVLVIESDGDPQVVELPVETIELLEVAEQGVPGPRGEQGIQGVPGAPGLSGANYVHQQMTPADTWVIQHGLSRFPSITIVDSAGSVVVGSVAYDHPNQITVTFTAAFGGAAYLN